MKSRVIEKAFLKLTGTFQNPKLKQKNTERILSRTRLVKKYHFFWMILIAVFWTAILRKTVLFFPDF